MPIFDHAPPASAAPPVPTCPGDQAARQPGMVGMLWWVNYKASSTTGADRPGIVMPTIPKGDAELFHFLAENG
ncbi:MAG: hypothetical protein ABSA01_10645 [Anaerolineales bacterium]